MSKKITMLASVVLVLALLYSTPVNALTWNDVTFSDQTLNVLVGDTQTVTVSAHNGSTEDINSFYFECSKSGTDVYFDNWTSISPPSSFSVAGTDSSSLLYNAGLWPAGTDVTFSWSMHAILAGHLRCQMEYSDDNFASHDFFTYPGLTATSVMLYADQTDDWSINIIDPLTCAVGYTGTYPACVPLDITTRDLKLISFGLAGFISWLFIKQFRWRANQ